MPEIPGNLGLVSKLLDQAARYSHVVGVYFVTAIGVDDPSANTFVPAKFGDLWRRDR